MPHRSAIVPLSLSLAVLVACAADRPAHDTPTADTAATSSRYTPPYTILSPDSGDVWQEGATYVIRWTRHRPGRVNVSAAVGGKDKGHLAHSLSAGTDSLRWRVPRGFVSGFGPERSDAVRIRIEDAADPRIAFESAPFTVTAALSPPDSDTAHTPPSDPDTASPTP